MNTGKPAIVVTAADLAPEAVALLNDFEIVYAGKQPDESSLSALCTLHQPVAIIVRYGKITPKIIRASERLRVISKHGSGIDTIDTDTARAMGIAVKAATAVNADAVAEHTWGLILACAKSIPQLNTRMHDGHWDKSVHKSLELKGRTLGLVGLGAIGLRVANIGIAMGLRVMGHDPYAKSAPSFITLAGLPELLHASDIVSLHCPLTADNRRMIRHETLNLMKDGAILINTARGGLVDESAVRDALSSGRLRAAGLDSFENEPPTREHLLSNAPNLVMTPHIGGVTSDAYVNMGIAAANNVIETLRQKTSPAI
jgi:D-3-phosphoglycerate dehydrogenase / 2-oxoglutarate reductase